MPTHLSVDVALQSVHPFELDRRLVAVDGRNVPFYRFDVVVVGAGAAGSVAALAAAEAGASVALLAKAGLQESNTRQAQGGVAAVLHAPDSIEAHVADTLRVGCGLSDRATVEAVIGGGPGAVRQMLELGTELDRWPTGDLQLSREGGHSHPRIVHARGDATGIEIQRAVTAAVEAHGRISTHQHTFAVDLITTPEGEASGVLCRTARGEFVGFSAPQVVIATGGAGQIYRETTNPAIATGDGIAMGFRAGAVVRDLEFVQFHPTCLYIAGAARVLISEIVRGAGGILRDRHGLRFMPQFHPQAELAPRDVVSRAVFSRMVATDDTSVYLDLSQLDKDPHLAFPGISRICRFFGIDIARDPIPVRPGAHYMIGGLSVDADGRTNVPGLWAVGECASSGLHGANRMGSNSLLEAIVLGSRTGREAGSRGRTRTASQQAGDTALAGAPDSCGVELNIEDMTYSLKAIMWRQMGVERDQPGLEGAVSKIEFWSRALGALAPDPARQPRAFELSNMLLLARLATLGALAREESRGVHWRSDYPSTDPAWCAHTRIAPELDGPRVASAILSREPLAEVVPAP
jgi:L-aspartate oxidase